MSSCGPRGLAINLGLDGFTDDMSALVDRKVSSLADRPGILGLDQSEAIPHTWIPVMSMGT